MGLDVGLPSRLPGVGPISVQELEAEDAMAGDIWGFLFALLSRRACTLTSYAMQVPLCLAALLTDDPLKQKAFLADLKEDCRLFRLAERSNHHVVQAFSKESPFREPFMKV
eukprot:1840134-Lingulodinium_polyedra.AAC.1